MPPTRHYKQENRLSAEDLGPRKRPRLDTDEDFDQDDEPLESDDGNSNPNDELQLQTPAATQLLNSQRQPVDTEREEVEELASPALQRRGRGRPKGSKNKVPPGHAHAARNAGHHDGQKTEQDVNQGVELGNGEENAPAPPKRRPGRPKGSKNKVRPPPTSAEDDDNDDETGGATAHGIPLAKNPGRVRKDQEAIIQAPRISAVPLETAKGYLPTIEEAPESELSLRGVWTNADVEALEKDWSQFDEAKLNPPSHTDEHPLWIAMVCLFHCVPRDLFRYGLKPLIRDTKNRLTVADQDIPYLNMGGSFCKHLLRVLCHPMWHGDLSRLRYALQMSVCSRITDHISPLGRMKSPPLLGEPSPRDVGNKLLSSWWSDGLPSDQGMTTLCEQMSRLVKETDKRSARSDQERLLFLLEDHHIRTVSKALETVTNHGRPLWNDTESYYVEFRNRRVKRNSHPPVCGDLREWKKICWQADKKDTIIRSRILHHDLHLKHLDVPEKDVHIAKYLADASDLPEDERSVLLGITDAPNLPEGYSIQDHTGA